MTPAEAQILGDAERLRRNLPPVLDRCEQIKRAREGQGKPGLTGTQRELVGWLVDELQRAHDGLRRQLDGEQISEADRAFLEDVRRQMGWETP